MISILTVVLSFYIHYCHSSNMTIQCIPTYNCSTSLDYYSKQSILFSYTADRDTWIDTPMVIIDNSTYSSSIYYNATLNWPTNTTFTEYIFILSPSIQNVPKDHSNGGYIQVRIAWKDKRLNDGFITGANMKTGPLFELKNSKDFPPTSSISAQPPRTPVPKYVIGSNTTSNAFDLVSTLSLSTLLMSGSWILF